MYRFAFALIIALNVTYAMAEDIFLQSQNGISHRYAVFEDDGKIAFLYLTEPGSVKPVKDAVVYSRVPPTDKVDWERIKKTGETPPLSAKVASKNAVVMSPKSSEFTFLWSTDGDSVAIIRNGLPLAMIAAKEKLGYSKAVDMASALASPWNDSRFREIFQK